MLKPELKQLIKEMTQEIYKIYELPELNATSNLEKVVQTLGGTVAYTYNKSTYQDSIVKTGENSFCIILPHKQTNEQNALSIGQRLGDLFLHMKYRSNESVWNNIPLNKPFESKDFTETNMSNYFAGYFLMPEDKFREIVQKNTDNKCNTKYVAKYFGVSISTASWWGYKLGLFEFL